MELGLTPLAFAACRHRELWASCCSGSYRREGLARDGLGGAARTRAHRNRPAALPGEEGGSPHALSKFTVKKITGCPAPPCSYNTGYRVHENPKVSGLPGYRTVPGTVPIIP